MVDMTDRLRMALRSEPWYLIKCEFGAGRDHEVVVIDRRAVRELDPVVRGMDPLGALGQEADPLALHDPDKVDLDFALLPPADRHPGIGGDEVIDRALRDHGQPIALSQLR